MHGVFTRSVNQEPFPLYPGEILEGAPAESELLLLLFV